MKKALKRALALALVCTMALALSPIVTAKGAAKKPALNRKKVRIEEGLAYDLKVKKNGYTIKSTKWSTSDKAVAKVKKGVVEAIAPGEATITAKVKAVAKGKKKAKTFTLKCKVTVLSADDENTDPPVGAWAPAETVTPDDTLKADVASLNDTSMTYKPLALLATQLVAGTNYRVLCIKTAANKSTYTILEYYKDLEGKVTKSYDWATTIEANTEGYTTPDSPSLGTYGDMLTKVLAAKQTDSVNVPIALVQQDLPNLKFLVICACTPKASDFGDYPAYSFAGIKVKSDFSDADIEKFEMLTEILAK